MKLLKVIERPLKDWDKPLKSELYIIKPNAEELEKAIAQANINGLDTIVIYN